jgi:hypothetical protein
VTPASAMLHGEPRIPTLPAGTFRGVVNGRQHPSRRRGCVAGRRCAGERASVIDLEGGPAGREAGHLPKQLRQPVGRDLLEDHCVAGVYGIRYGPVQYEFGNAQLVMPAGPVNEGVDGSQRVLGR